VTHIVVTASADADMARIIADLGAKAGARVAARYNADFERVFERLADFPGSGAPRPRFGENVRICIVSPYTGFYEHVRADDIIRIMRIAHGRRIITRKFLRE
jgi:toxin ParE1/3/4